MAQVPSTTITTYTAPKKFPYDIYVTPECLVKMNEYGRAAQPCEVGGLARLQIDRENKNIFVTDIRVFQQNAYSAFFQIEPEAINAWMRDMVKEGRGDELSEWKSIFHTHPVGMGPSMSAHDVDEIESYAEEEDAFSFILSASNNADSTRMFMHYCCNMYGVKHVIRDIPVSTSISADRVELSTQMTKYLYKKLGGKDQLDDKDYDKLDGLVAEFLTDKVPTYFSEGRDKLRSAIEKHVTAVVSKNNSYQTNKNVGYTPQVGNYAAGKDSKRQREARAVENDAMYEIMEDAVSRGEMSQYEANEYFARMTDDEHDDVGYVLPATGGKYEKELKEINHLFCLAFEDYDSQNPNREITQTRAKKAARMWELRTKKLNEKLRKETDNGIGLYDLVMVDYNRIETNPDNAQNTDLDKIPHTVDNFVHDKTGWSFEVEGELFWSHELVVIETFEDAIEDAKKKAMINALEKEDNKVRENKLAEASKMMDEALMLGPGDTTDTNTPVTN